jgi:PDDEXK-like domain of unknown function (DUF3799)
VTILEDAPVVTKPGIYDGMPEALYHSDPVPGGSLSSTGARRLLPPSCPAKFRYELDHPRQPSGEMELGTAAHRLILGTGPEFVVVDEKSWRKASAQEAADKARADGKVPLLIAERRQVDDMADAIMAHPIARDVFSAQNGGRPEQSLFCQDPDTGVWCRVRMDWMPSIHSARPSIVDYKTAHSANPAAFVKSAANLGYHVQAGFYQMVYRWVTGIDAGFAFVVQEKEPPYLVTICELDRDSMQEGRDLGRLALEIYRDCKAADLWPAYSDDIELVRLPSWALGRNLRGGY